MDRKEVFKMGRKEELSLMLKGAEITVLYACKDLCDKGLTSKTIEPLDYAIAVYHNSLNSLVDYEKEYEPENLTEVVDNAE